VYQGRMIAEFGLSKDLDNSSISLSSSLFGMPALIEPKCFAWQKIRHMEIFFGKFQNGYPPFESCSEYLIPY